MPENWVIQVDDDEQIAFEAVCGDPLELGRQDEINGEQLYQLSMKPEGGCRLSIARTEEVSVSRRQARIESTGPNGHVRIKNISSNVPFSLGNGRPVKPATEVAVELPVLLRFGKRTVRLEDPTAQGPGRPFEVCRNQLWFRNPRQRDGRLWRLRTSARPARATSSR